MSTTGTRPASPSGTRGDFSRLPVINISGLFSSVAADRQAVADAIGDAARTVGFFYVTGHGIPAAQIAALRLAAADFYAQSLDWKMRNYIGLGRGHKGFVPEGEEVYAQGRPDHKEAYDIGFEAADDHPMVQAGLPLIGGNKWPDLPGFKPAVQAYYASVFGLGQHLAQVRQALEHRQNIAVQPAGIQGAAEVIVFERRNLLDHYMVQSRQFIHLAT